MNTESFIYDRARTWISDKRNKNNTWESLMLACKTDIENLKVFLETKVEDDDWPEITVEEWQELVESERAAEEETILIDKERGAATIHEDFQNNDVLIPFRQESSWQTYKKGMLSNGFTNDTVKEIERSTFRILKRLSLDTTKIAPIKGLVIGNVQSGKTANMAALMSMAADCGWNMFIVLSGTIENLRLQTQSRLFTDLSKTGCTLMWRSLEHLGPGMPTSFRAQDMNFGEDSHERYFTVCLKNPSRLRNLIKWLQEDANTQRQLKILVIDDEADQAGINTADINDAERKPINDLICNLVNGKKFDGEPCPNKYQAMNYIGFTATPYANVLNESGEDSLYPKNFIATLRVSNEYFGPQQIFGEKETQYDGLDIIRRIKPSDIDDIKEIHQDNIRLLPQSGYDALCWFLCGVGCMRYWGYKKPITMLVHTSQRTDHHQHIADTIEMWIQATPIDEIIRFCRIIWEKEKARFTPKALREQYPDYGRDDSEIRPYPEFDEIEGEIRNLLSGKRISSIPLDAKEKMPEYHQGIHLCIDNCKNNGVENDMILRLVYPDKDHMPEPAPAFIVVGGATLSRGLTLEGLISTYFLRDVKQSDTLMQMGRWFGYRRGYELIPRVWLSENTEQQFEFLSSLDQELRDEIHRMDVCGISPANYGPRVKNSPKLSFIRIVARNRMQSAVASDMDFTGAAPQTYMFDNDEKILSSNMELTREFLKKIGNPEKKKPVNVHAQHSYVWRGVDFKEIKHYLEGYQFQARQSTINNIGPLLDWFEEPKIQRNFDKWNVVLVGAQPDSKHDKSWNLWNDGRADDISIRKVIRTQKSKNKIDGILNLGALRAPKDMLDDIDLEHASASLKAKVTSFKSRFTMDLRNEAGLGSTPQLLIYIVDKDSKTGKPMASRVDLNAKEDIAGLCINIPGDNGKANFVASVSIPMPAADDPCNYNEEIDETIEN